MKDVFDGKVITLVKNRWSSIHVHNEHLVARCMVSDGKAYHMYLDADESSSMSMTAENCDVLCRNLLIRQRHFITNFKIKSIITDNAKSMEKTRRMLVEEHDDLNVHGRLFC